MRKLLTVLAAVGVLAAGGCAADDEPAAPAVCDSFAAVQNTVNHIREVNVSENGLVAIRPYVAQLLNELNQLVLDAKAQFGAQADQLRATVDQLQTSVGTAREDPNVTNLAAVRTSVGAVRESAVSLRDVIAGTCP
ncbi:hypothetical protein AB0M02_14385 [Actinoplanes sp. NPDC051861]|uniref:hypothetical protein n=1 Tax=Actinoplanes sp. NPDC051861 TaxID=3155170 RepID=UPI00341809C5